MKLFPNKRITVRLTDDRTATLIELRRNTKLTDRLVSDYTNKGFIGQVNDCGFKIISSEIGWGAFCVFVGDFQDSSGEIEIQIHRVFKVLFSILMLMPLIGFGISIVAQGIEESIAVIAPMALGILFIRFVFMEISFRVISKIGITKLTRIIGVKELNENHARHQP
jgi:hypothetical protein